MGTIHPSLGPYIVGNNTTDIIFYYNADAAITGNLNVTLQNVTGAIFNSNSQPLVIGSDPRRATATFRMTVPSSGSVTFGAKVNDSENTSLSPTYRGTITGYDPASVQLQVSGTVLQAGDSAAIVKAATELKTADGSHDLEGEDIIVWAQGSTEEEDAFDKFVDVYLDPNGAPLTDFETVDFGDARYKALRLNTNPSGFIRIYIRPKQDVECGVVTLNSKVGTQSLVAQAETVFILDPTPKGSRLVAPSISYLDGLYLDPPAGDTDCKAHFPAPPGPSASGYAITNVVDGTHVILDAKEAEDVTVADGMVLYPFPYSELTNCKVHGGCQTADLNQIGYLIFSDVTQEVAYSENKIFYYDPAPPLSSLDR